MPRHVGDRGNTPRTNTPSTSNPTGPNPPSTPSTTTPATPERPASWRPRPARPRPAPHTPARPTTPAPIHFEGPATFEGAKLKPEALSGAFRGVTAEKFGTTDVVLASPDGSKQTFNVRDMHYDLGDGKIGMRLIPVSDNDPAAAKKMDDYLRKEMGLRDGEPIYALLSYIHPEEHTGDLKQLGTEDRKSTRLNSSHIQKSRMPSSA